MQHANKTETTGHEKVRLSEHLVIDPTAENVGDPYRDCFVGARHLHENCRLITPALGFL